MMKILLSVIVCIAIFLRSVTAQQDGQLPCKNSDQLAQTAVNGFNYLDGIDEFKDSDLLDNVFTITQHCSKESPEFIEDLTGLYNISLIVNDIYPNITGNNSVQLALYSIEDLDNDAKIVELIAIYLKPLNSTEVLPKACDIVTKGAKYADESSKNITICIDQLRDTTKPFLEEVVNNIFNETIGFLKQFKKKTDVNTLTVSDPMKVELHEFMTKINGMVQTSKLNETFATYQNCIMSSVIDIQAKLKTVLDSLKTLVNAGKYDADISPEIEHLMLSLK